MIEARLIELLRSLRPDEWEIQTIAPAWKVKDVAAHLLDTQLRKLSLVRDGYAPARRRDSVDRRVLAFINRLNREGVEMYRRLSPAVLISMMEIASRESAEFHQSLDPMAEAAFSVSWAGEETSLNWFDTARELTERWHHQQQIRLATNRPGIMTRELYYPVLDCFMRALPFKYRDRVRQNLERTCGSTYQETAAEAGISIATGSAGCRSRRLKGGRCRRRRFRRTSRGASSQRGSTANRPPRRCQSPAIAILEHTC